MKIWVKLHSNAQGEVLAACDEDLLGKTFEEQRTMLNVKKEFYQGDLLDKEEFSGLLKENENINLVGTETINTAKEQGVVKETLSVQKIPYAMIFKM